MTTLGLGIASENQYDIVTPSSQFHETLLATGEEGIFNALLGTTEQVTTRTSAQARLDLGQLVITLTGVNYRALRPEDIPELQASKSFRKFRHLIREKARNISLESSPEKSEEQILLFKRELSFEAEEIIESWHETKTDLCGELKDALFEQAAVLSGDILTAQIKAIDAKELAVAGGVSIALLANKFLRWRKKRGSSPYQYLTEVVQAQDEYLRMTFPLGLDT